MAANMEIAVPIVAGVVCGLLGGVPYAVAAAVSRRTREASIFPAVVAVCVSILVVALSVLAAWALLRDGLLLFAIALVVMFLLAVVASVLLLGRKPRSTCEE